MNEFLHGVSIAMILGCFLVSFIVTKPATVEDALFKIAAGLFLIGAVLAGK